MDSSFNLLDLLDGVDGAYATIIGFLFMVIANLCHILKNKYSTFMSVLFSSLSCAVFVMILFGVFPNLFDAWYTLPIIVLSSYVLFLYYVEDVRFGLLGSFILALAISAPFYIAGLSIVPVIIIVLLSFVVIAIISLMIGVASAIFSDKAICYTVRIFGFLLYFFLVSTLINLFI